ncbi:MAG: V-type ATP synthase subunit E family protein [Chloroflexota bacterium]|nr:V-type ATP synthase subunit E family protein [Chloroflexota bacterium]
MRTKSIPQGFSGLSRGVLGEARAEAREILENAEAKAERIRRQAREQAEARREEILGRAKQKTEPIRRQAIASAQLEAQRLQLESREELLRQVFSAAREELRSAPQWPDYPEILRYLIREAASNVAAEEIAIHADAQTQEYLSDPFLRELGEQLGVRLRRGELLDEGVGIVAETPNGHRLYRNTLEARLRRLRESLRAPVYRLLRGRSP